MSSAKAEKKKLIKVKHSRLERRRAVWGYAFISLWLIGSIIFFIIPLIQAFIYSVNDIKISNGALDLTFSGMSNYKYLLFDDPDFFQDFGQSISEMLLNVAVIVPFSLFTAVILREKFFGRTLARAIFFFPVILSSGIVLTVLKEQVMGSSDSTLELATASQSSYMFEAPDFAEIFEKIGLPTQIMDFIQDLLSRIFDITWKSGVQILLLLSAVNSISSSSYEAADIEGATGWEKFWKITFPMVSPTLLVAIIYTIIDSFTDLANPVIQKTEEFMAQGYYAYSTALGLMYFICVLLIIGIIYFIINRFVFYENDR